MESQCTLPGGGYADGQRDEGGDSWKCTKVLTIIKLLARQKIWDTILLWTLHLLHLLLQLQTVHHLPLPLPLDWCIPGFVFISLLSTLSDEFQANLLLFRTHHVTARFPQEIVSLPHSLGGELHSEEEQWRHCRGKTRVPKSYLFVLTTSYD